MRGEAEAGSCGPGVDVGEELRGIGLLGASDGYPAHVGRTGNLADRSQSGGGSLWPGITDQIAVENNLYSGNLGQAASDCGSHLLGFDPVASEVGGENDASA
jgi:hypothetical protein